MRSSCVKKILSVIIFLLIAGWGWWPQVAGADDAEDDKIFVYPEIQKKAFPQIGEL